MDPSLYNKLSERPFADLTDVTLADEDTNSIKEERKTLMLRLDRNINLCCDYMLRLHVAISCCNQMSIFQLDFPFLLLSISQNWNSASITAFFGLDFPFLLLSISQNLEFCIFECPFGLDFPFLLLSISQN